MIVLLKHFQKHYRALQKQDYEDYYNNNIRSIVEKEEPINYRKLISGTVLLITSIVIFILFFREIFNIPKKINIQLN